MIRFAIFKKNELILIFCNLSSDIVLSVNNICSRQQKVHIYFIMKLLAEYNEVQKLTYLLHIKSEGGANGQTM